jgi:hypothetical protein
MKLKKGAGAGIGALIGLAVVGLKHFGIWPFNRRKGSSQSNQQKHTDGSSEKSMDTSSGEHRRNHPRSWTPADST